MSRVDRIMDLLKDLSIHLVSSDHADLTARQLSMFLLIHQERGPHTVRGFAALLDIAKPAVTRTADRLEEHGLIQRLADPNDRRSVLLVPTSKGRDLYQQIMSAVRNARPAKASA